MNEIEILAEIIRTSMILRQLSPMTTTLRSCIVTSNRTMQTRHSRNFATSAQKRKWLLEKGRNKPFLKKKYADLKAEDAGTIEKSKPTENNWQPLFFLSVFPVFMSIAVVLARDDLREEVNAKGIGRFLEDYKRWRRNSLATNASAEKEQREQESEYDRMLNHLELQKASATSTSSMSGDGRKPIPANTGRSN